MRLSIADFEVNAPWPGGGRRWVCRPPERLRRDGPVLVGELAVDAEGWQQLCDTLIRLVSAGGDGLVEVLEVGPDPATGGVYLATEAANIGRPAGPDRLAAVTAAARTAHALHEAGVTHGAIAPAAFLSRDGRPVLDLPRLDGPAGQVVQVGDWSDLITVDPALLAGELPSRASEVWALGATLHALMSDRPLFPGIEGDEPVTAVQRVMFTRPEIDRSLPGDVRELVEACLAADPAERPATAAEVADRLEPITSAAAGGGR